MKSKWCCWRCKTENSIQSIRRWRNRLTLYVNHSNNNHNNPSTSPYCSSMPHHTHTHTTNRLLNSHRFKHILFTKLMAFSFSREEKNMIFVSFYNYFLVVFRRSVRCRKWIHLCLSKAEAEKETTYRWCLTICCIYFFVLHSTAQKYEIFSKDVSIIRFWWLAGDTARHFLKFLLSPVVRDLFFFRLELKGWCLISHIFQQNNNQQQQLMTFW